MRDVSTDRGRSSGIRLLCDMVLPSLSVERAVLAVKLHHMGQRRRTSRSGTIGRRGTPLGLRLLAAQDELTEMPCDIRDGAVTARQAERLRGLRAASGAGAGPTEGEAGRGMSIIVMVPPFQWKACRARRILGREAR